MRERPHERSVRVDAPMLGFPILLEHLQSTALPRLVARQSDALCDDPIHFLPHKHLCQRELRLGTECRHGLITDLQQRAPRNRVFVMLDLRFDEQLVFVFEGTRRIEGALPTVEECG